MSTYLEVKKIEEKVEEIAGNFSGDINVNVEKINGHFASTDRSNADSGTLRVAVCNDDINLSSINSHESNIDLYTGHLNDCVNHGSNWLHINIQACGDQPIPTESGIIVAGTQRICIADDDTNLAQLNTILSDVWDPVTHSLRVSAV